MLDFLKLVGHASRSKSQRADNFKTAFSRLLQFFPCGTTSAGILSATKNTQPFIVGKYARSKKEVIQWFLVLHPVVIPLPSCTTLIGAIDLLHKVFHIFHLEYPDSLQRLYGYFDEFILQIGKMKFTRSTQLNARFIREMKSQPSNYEELEAVEVEVEVIVPEATIETLSEDFNLHELEQFVVEQSPVHSTTQTSVSTFPKDSAQKPDQSPPKMLVSKPSKPPAKCSVLIPPQTPTPKRSTTPNSVQSPRTKKFKGTVEEKDANEGTEAMIEPFSEDPLPEVEQCVETLVQTPAHSPAQSPVSTLETPNSVQNPPTKKLQVMDVEVSGENVQNENLDIQSPT